MQTKHTSHKIRTQKVDVTFESPENAFGCKSQLGEVCKSKLLPALEKLFDEKTSPEKLIRIDNLSVDAGLLQKENWETQLVENVISALSKYLDGIQTDRKPDSKSRQEKQNEPQLDNSSSPAIGSEAKVQKAGSEQEALIHFLQHGVLPWYTTIQSKATLQKVFNAQISKPDFQQKVGSLFLKNEKAFERLFYHFEEDAVFALLENYKIKKQKLMAVQESFYSIFKELAIRTTRQKPLFFKSVYQVLYKAKTTEALEEKMALEIVKQLQKDEQESLMKIAENTENHSFTTKDKNLIRLAKKHINQQEKAETKVEKVEKTIEKAKPEKRRVPIIFEDENPVFVTNAGLVLLHPFLGRLFENVGYTENSQWLSEEVQQRALVLSQFLVTGTEEYAEYELILNKILTGYPIEDTLSDEIELSAYEKDEANDLLQSVINHWKALKNTSISGVQNTFLQREGKVVKKESGWLMQVEQKAFDILLDKIPWGFSTIKTPWMEEILSVEWT